MLLLLLLEQLALWMQTPLQAQEMQLQQAWVPLLLSMGWQPGRQLPWLQEMPAPPWPLLQAALPCLQLLRWAGARVSGPLQGSQQALVLQGQGWAWAQVQGMLAQLGRLAWVQGKMLQHCLQPLGPPCWPAQQRQSLGRPCPGWLHQMRKRAVRGRPPILTPPVGQGV